MFFHMRQLIKRILANHILESGDTYVFTPECLPWYNYQSHPFDIFDGVVKFMFTCHPAQSTTKEGAETESIDILMRGKLLPERYKAITLRKACSSEEEHKNKACCNCFHN